MAKVLKTVGVIAGAVALVATGVGAFAGAAFAASAAGTTVASIATYAGIAAGVANIGASLAYSHKPPPARGSVTRILIDPDAPQPYAMGEGYLAGVLRHDVAYGPTLKKVPNPYRLMVVTYSGGGPIEQITPYVDQGPIPAWYTGFLYNRTQLGAVPEGAALIAQWSGAPGWDTSSKLSGYAAIAWSLKFDKDGERFASGVPQLGAYGKWVKVYDPRLDSTYPGGSGSHRVDDETTWTWSECPALHAGTYALGRFQNGKRVLGVGLPASAIDWAAVVAWANVCDANSWSIFGVVWEPMPDTRWPNLKDIAAAGGGVPIHVCGKLSFTYPAPRVAIDTVTEADLIEGGAHQVTAMTSRKGRINTIYPKYRSPDHNWELVTAGAAVVGSTYVTEDGETRSAEWPFNLVKDGDQAAQLAAYRIAEGRELQPIELTCGERLAEYAPGDCLHLDIPTLALDHDAVIVAREFDPATLTTRFTLISETADKHDWALGRTITPPPTPGLAQTAQERDELAAAAQKPYGWQLAIIRSALIKDPRDGSDVSRALLIGTDAGASATISVARHDWDYPDGTTDLTRETGTITGLAFATTYYVYFDDADLDDGAPTYFATTDRAAALNSSSNPDRHPLGWIKTPADGGADTVGGSLVPGYDYPPEPAEGAIDAAFSPPFVNLPASKAGAITSYVPAVFEFVARLQDGSDISDQFTLALASGGNPAGLTYSIDNGANPRTVTVTGGLTAAECPTTLTIEATGSGDYADAAFVREIPFDADYSGVMLQQLLTANDQNALTPPSTGQSITGLALETTHADGTVTYKVNFNWTYSSDPDDDNNFDAILWLLNVSDTSTPVTLGGPSAPAAGERGGLLWVDVTDLTTTMRILSKMDPTKWYTIGFAKWRKVATATDPRGYIHGPITQYGPFRPASVQQATSGLDLSQTGGFMSKLTGTDQVRPIPRGLTSVTIPLSSTADIKIDLKRFKNGVDVTSSSTWAIAASHNCSVSVGASTGIVTVTGSSLGQVVTGERGNAYAIVTATDATGAVERWKLGFELDLGALVSIDSSSARPFVVANPGGISSFSQTFYSYVMSDTLTYRTGSVGGRRIVAVYEYASPFSGQFGIDLMLQEKLTSSGTWLDSFEYTAFDPVDYDANYLRKRYAVILSDATGVTANTSYDARIRPKKTTGVVGGSGLIEGKVFAAQGY